MPLLRIEQGIAPSIDSGYASSVKLDIFHGEPDGEHELVEEYTFDCKASDGWTLECSQSEEWAQPGRDAKPGGKFELRKNQGSTTTAKGLQEAVQKSTVSLLRKLAVSTQAFGELPELRFMRSESLLPLDVKRACVS